MVEGIQIRPVRPGDEVAVVNLIRELADFEKLLDEMVATPGDLREALFAENPAAEALIGEFDGAPVAFALFFYTFSTFEGRKSLYLEDLYVKPEYRGRGFGTKFLKTLARIAVERECARFEWAALDWNELAIRVYKGIGAEAMDGWTTFRLDGKALLDFSGH